MKIFIFSRRLVAITLIIVLCGVVLIAINFQNLSNFVTTGTVKRSLPIYRVRTDEKVVALSFDAAWGNEDTGQLIDILGKYNIKATFFVVGSWVDKYPESVKALHDAGHEIMNHSNTHPHMPQLSREKMMEEVNKCNEKIQAVTGVKPHLFRPPYGDYNNLSIETLKEMGMYTIQWDVDSLDWKDKTADEIIQRVTNKVKNGSIVLFHNAAKNTPAALPAIIENLLAKGYKFKKISELIYTENYAIDHAGEQYLIGGAEKNNETAPNADQPGTGQNTGEQGTPQPNAEKPAGVKLKVKTDKISV